MLTPEHPLDAKWKAARVVFFDLAARAKLNGAVGYDWVCVERFDDGTTRVEFAKPVGTYASGPRKGRTKYDRKASLAVLVTSEEIEAERQKYIAETGNCIECYGLGQRMYGWNSETGNRYRECNHCHGTGKEPINADR